MTALPERFREQPLGPQGWLVGHRRSHPGRQVRVRITGWAQHGPFICTFTQEAPPITLGLPLPNGAVPLAYSVRVGQQEGHVLARTDNSFVVWSWEGSAGRVACFWGDYYQDLRAALLAFTAAAQLCAEQIHEPY